MTQRHCRACGGWHDLSEPWPAACVGHFSHRLDRAKRSDLASPYFVCDTMDPVQSMVTGQWHDSKASLRSEYRQHGVVEVGTDKSAYEPCKEIDAGPSEREIEASVAQAFEQLGA